MAAPDPPQTPDAPRASRFRGYAMVLAAATCWGISGTVAQALFQQEGFQPGWLVTVRMLLSGFGLLLLAGLRSSHSHSVWSIWKEPADRKAIVGFGVAGMLGVQYTYFAAIEAGNAATATLLQFTAPIFILGYTAFANRKLPSPRECPAVALASLGTLLLVTNGSLDHLSLSWQALAWGLGSAAALTFYTIYPGKLLRKWGSLLTVGWGMIVGGTGLAVINPPWQMQGQHWSLHVFGYTAFIVIFGTLVAFYLFIDSLNYISPTEASIMASAEPLSAVLLSTLWLKVPFGIMDACGAFCIILTVFILAFESNRSRQVSLQPSQIKDLTPGL